MFITSIQQFPYYSIDLNDGREKYRFAVGITGSVNHRRYVVRVTQFLEFDNFTQERENLDTFVDHESAVSFIQRKARLIVTHSDLTPGEQRRAYPHFFNV